MILQLDVSSTFSWKSVFSSLVFVFMAAWFQVHLSCFEVIGNIWHCCNLQVARNQRMMFSDPGPSIIQSVNHAYNAQFFYNFNLGIEINWQFYFVICFRLLNCNRVAVDNNVNIYSLVVRGMCRIYFFIMCHVFLSCVYVE